MKRGKGGDRVEAQARSASQIVFGKVKFSPFSSLTQAGARDLWGWLPTAVPYCCATALRRGCRIHRGREAAPPSDGRVLDGLVTKLS